jgi:hypothetical protein
MNKRKLIQRIISLPFYGLFIIDSIITLYFKWLRNCTYGGEVIAYEDENKSIKDLYFLMKRQTLAMKPWLMLTVFF